MQGATKTLMRVNIYDGIQWVILHKSELTAHAIKKQDIWIKYINLYSGFDIETTRVGNNSYMYKWQLSLMTETSPCPPPTDPRAVQN